MDEPGQNPWSFFWGGGQVYCAEVVVPIEGNGDYAEP